jgi:hypothetical protein
MDSEISDADRELEERAEKAVDELFNVVNKMGGGEKALIKVLSRAMNRQHRTLIQQFWGVIAIVIRKYADEGQCDLRNQDSLNWAKEVSKIESYMRYI